MWPVARHSFVEPLRNPWMLIGLLVFSALFTFMLFASLADQGFVIARGGEVDVSMFFGFANGFLVPFALVLGFGLISQEIASSTVFVALLRPVPRWAYLLGRILGRMGLLAVLFAVLAGSVEIMALVRGAAFDPYRVVLWLGLLLTGESVIVLFAVLGTVASRFGSVVLFFLLMLMFNQIAIFTAARTGSAWWKGIAAGADVLRGLVLGPPLRLLEEAAMSPWHTGWMLAGWLGHAGFLFALGAVLFRFRELGVRE